VIRKPHFNNHLIVKISLNKLRKEKNWDNFMNKIQNLSNARKESIKISNRKFDEFCLKNYQKSRDEIIAYVKTLDNEEREDQLLDLSQEWLNHLHKTLVVSSMRVKITDINRFLNYQNILNRLNSIWNCENTNKIIYHSTYSSNARWTKFH